MKKITELVERMKKEGVLEEKRSWTNEKYKDLLLVGKKDKNGVNLIMDVDVKDYDTTGEIELTWEIKIYTRKGMTRYKEIDIIVVDSLDKVEEKIREIYKVEKTQLEIFEEMQEKRRKKAEENLAKVKIYTSCLVSELEKKLEEEIEVEYFDTIYGPAAQLTIDEVQVSVYPLAEDKEKFIVYNDGYNWRTNSPEQLYLMIEGLL